MSFEGVMQDGKVVFDGPAPLPDGTTVRVEPAEQPAATPATTPKDGPSFLEEYKDILRKAAGTPSRTLLERMGDVVGKAEGLPEDAARNVDHYLYGHPKR